MMLPPKQPDLTGLVVLRKELIAQGLTDNHIANLARTGVLHRIRHGAYVRGEEWAALAPHDQHRLLTRAVLRTAAPGTVATHCSGIIERGIPLWGCPLDIVHTTRPGRAGRRTRDWVPHRSALTADDIETVNGIPVTRAPLAAVEITTTCGVEASLIAVNGLLRAKAMTLEEFQDEVKACRFWPRTLTSNLVAHLADPRLESIGEDRFSYFIHRQGLLRPEPQVVIHDEFGEEFARVDFAWVELGVFVEFDGRVKYEHFRREDESLEQFLMREKDREERICQLTGWVCIRVSWADFSTPGLLAGRIRRLLSSRRPVVG